MRKFIDLMESIKDETLVDHIATMVRQGHHEGFKPYWKLIADPRILEDEATMMHVSDLIAAGFMSGSHPTWELKAIEADAAPDLESAPADAETHPVADPVEHMIDEEDIDPTDIAYDDPEIQSGRDIQAYLDNEHHEKHKVVPVHQRDGEGAGWFECMDEEAELYVVEDEFGNPVEGHAERNSAEAHAHSLNSPVMLDEIDVDPTDNDADMAPTMFDKAPDYQVIINAIHERGQRQDEALRELNLRGLWLNDDQKTKAGLSLTEAHGDCSSCGGSYPLDRLNEHALCLECADAY